MNVVSVRRILQGKSSDLLIQIEKAPAQKGNENIQPLLEAIMERQVIELHYKSFFSDKEKVHILHPYLLKEYRNRWYVIGLHDFHKNITPFALDRIIKLKIKEATQYIHDDFIPEHRLSR